MSDAISIVDLLERLRQLDVRVWVDGDRLRVNAPPGVLTAELQQQIGLSKPGLMEMLRQSAGRAEDSIPRRPERASSALSFTQERMWVLHELEPGSTAYHVIQSDRFFGELDVPALARAWHRLTSRHDALRTRVCATDGVPVAVVDPVALATAFYFEDLSGQPATAIAARSRELFCDTVERPFDLAAGPLASLVVVRIRETDHVVTLRVHHIITDYWSQGLIRRELAAFYRSEVTGEPDALPPLPIRYADYVDWQRERLQAATWDQLLDYWRGQLAGLEPLDVAAGSPQDESDRSGQTTIRLADGLLDRLNSVALRTGATLFMVMLAVFAVLIHRYTGRMRLPVGIPVAGRSRRELEPLVGAFINTLVLRLEVQPSEAVEDVIQRVKHVTLDALAHQDAPFERLVAALVPARQTAATPLVQVMFNLLGSQGPPVEFPGLRIEPVEINRLGATLDLSMIVDAAGGYVTAEYRHARLFGVSVERMLDHYARLLDSVATDPSRSVLSLPMLAEEDLGVLTRINDTVVSFDRDASVEDMVHQQAARRPDAVAVRAGDRHVTYADLDRRVNVVAAALRGLGVGPDTLIGVCLQRSEIAPIVFLGILRAGGAYLPLDPDFPRARLQWMMQDSAVGLVLADAQSVDVLPTMPGVRVIDVAEMVATGSTEALPPSGASGEHLAYVLYTSGSTGLPKGVQIPRRALANLIIATQERPKLGADDVLVAVTTFSFDIAGLELFLPLSVGGTVVLAGRHEATDGHALRALLTQTGATVMQATPATWRLLLDAGWDGSTRLKVLCGGERFPSDLAARLTVLSDEVWNMYGPTETTIWSTAERVTEDRAIGIGQPLANTEVYVLDPQGQRVPPGVAGELHIGGEGLARGYLGRPDLTARAFVPDRFSGRPSARLYRTGDLARIRPDGALDFLGRLDGQVKVRGFRIEPGEIESALAELPEVDQAAVVVRERGGHPLLVAYFTTRTGDAVKSDLRAHLQTKLPGYMIPGVFVRVDSLPLTPNGKIDRRALRDLGDVQPIRGATSRDPHTATEIRLAAIWADILGVTKVGSDDDFFALGGHSLLVMRLASQIEKTFGVPMPPGILFECSVLHDLASWLDARLDSGRSVPQRVLVQMASGGEGAPFFWTHGVGGEVFTYMHLSDELSRHRPVFGFTADWTTMPGGQDVTLEAMARRYVHEMRRVQPSGPYHIGGFCSAALLALEMARQLEDLGQTVGLVAVLDYQISRTNVPPGSLRALQAFIRNLPHWYRDDAALSARGELMGRLRSGAKRVYGRFWSGAKTGAESSARQVDVRDQLGMWRFPDYQVPMLEAHHRALTSYRPRPFGGTVALFLPTAAPLLGPWSVSGTNGWEQVAGGGLHVHLVPGSHSTMLSEAFAPRLADLLERELSEVETSMGEGAARSA